MESGNLIFSKGKPAICIPVMGADRAKLAYEIQKIHEVPCDLVEWRADFMLEQLAGMSFGSAVRTLLDTLGYIKANLDKPLLFTIRTSNEGGQVEIAPEDYFFINRMVADSGMAELIDIEAFIRNDTDMVNEYVKYAHRSGQKVILSNHDFEKTPSVEDMIVKYHDMMDMNGDVIKLAVMPHSENDVANLLQAASQIHDANPDQLLIAISMGELGMGSRICAGQFGSVITFAAGANASAPGQIDAVTLQEYLEKYYI